MRKYIVLLTVLVLLFLQTLEGKWTDNIRDYFNATAPSVGMSFLKVGMGARAIALGGAYSPIVKDPTAVYWNPGAVIYTKGLDVSFSHISLMEDIRYEFVAVSSGDGNQGFGLGMGGLFYGGMELRDERPSIEPVGTFDAYSFVFKICYGHKLGNDIIGGFSINGIIERIYIYTTHTYTFDFGMRYAPNIMKPLVFSLNLVNLGPKLKYLDEPFRLPLTAKLGSSYSLRKWKTDFILTTELSKSIDTPLSSAAGVEAGFPHLSLRFGYKFNRDNISSWSTGFGIHYRNLSFDYSFAPYLFDFGAKQCVSLNLNF